MALHNVRRKEHVHAGRATWRLFDSANVEILIFFEFCLSISDLAYSTRLRYVIVVSRFLDYLYEMGVLGGKAVTRGVINDAIDYYKALLKFGVKIIVSPEEMERAALRGVEIFSQARLREVAEKLEITVLASNSWDNTIAPLNRFLRLNGLMEREAYEIALLRRKVFNNPENQEITRSYPLIQAVEGTSYFSQAEIIKMKQSSMLGSIIDLRGGALTRLKGLSKSKRQELEVDLDSLDFPEEHFPALLEAATSYRDCAAWTLAIGTGLRRSEGLNTKWSNIDFNKQKVFAVDPELTQYGQEYFLDEKHLRNKGRESTLTYFRRPYREWFFYYLKKYREEEYSLPQDGNDFVFQYLISRYRGRPLLEASDESLNSSFKSAVKRAKIPGPTIAPNYVWTSHSLRHSFGRYMLNDFKVPGQEEPGLTLLEVQTLLAQKDIKATRVYAKPRSDELRRKLSAHELAFAMEYSAPPRLKLR